MSGDGPGRRLSASEEDQAARLFAGGASDRQVAAALEVGTGTANRLRHRLAARIAELSGHAAGDEPQETAVEEQQDGIEEGGGALEVTPVLRAFGSDVVLTHPGLAEIEAAAPEIELEAERDELVKAIAMHEDRAAASRGALAGLEAERIRLLDSDSDAAPLRPRIAQARDDLADSETAAQLARGRLAPVEARLAELAALRDLAAMREQLAAAVAERDAECARTGDRQRAAVLAVRDAAVEFVAALADERRVVDRVDQLERAVAAGAAAYGEPRPVVPPAPGTGLHVDPSLAAGGPLALMRAFSEAQVNRPEAVAVRLAEAYGWLPPDPAEVAAEMERMRAWREGMARQAAAPQTGQPWTRGDTSQVGLDRGGREIGGAAWPWGRPHPLDAYWGGTPAPAPQPVPQPPLNDGTFAARAE